jgi:hypothetical protein
MKGKLLSTANPKTAKSKGEGYLTFILHLSPANRSGYQVCHWATPECIDLCLNTSGHGGICKKGETTNAVQEARIRRTHFMFLDREAFLKQLVGEIEHAISYAKKHDLEACFRLNGTSDLLWERFPVVRNGVRYANVFEAFAGVKFYDYTKAPFAVRRHDIPNYHLTFSWAETDANHGQAKLWYEAGHSVAVVFNTKRGKPLPAFFDGKPVYDADIDDLRFKDPHGIAGLRAKGRAKKQHRPFGGFVISERDNRCKAA